MKEYSTDEILITYENEVARLRTLLDCQVGLPARITASEIVQLQALIDSLKILLCGYNAI